MERFVPLDPKIKVDENSMLKIEAILQNYPEKKDLFKVYGYANANFIDDEDVPMGLLSIHPINAEVHVDSIPEHAFQYLVVNPILLKDGVEYTDTDFPISNKIDEAAPQYSEKPPSLYIQNKNNQDMDEWSAELGQDGFAGVFKKIKENSSYSKI